MLRIAVISLLVANLLLLGFRGSKPVAEPETVAKQAVVEDSGVPTIHLFSEMMNDQDLMSGSRRCFSLGPFHSVEDKNETRALLEDVSANVSERETQALVEKGYWVFMPPYESLLVANQALLSLQALGLKDIAVIYNGDWEKAISLGYFLRQENALRRKKELEDRSFAPKIRVQRQSESRYWLDYEQNPGSGLIAMDMQNRPNDFMQRSLPCPDQNPFEEKSTQREDGGGEQSIEEIDIGSEETIGTTPVENAEVAAPEPAIDDGVDPEEVIDSTSVDNEMGESNQAIETEPENDPETELQNSNEAEAEAPEDFVDDTLQEQVGSLEAGDEPQPIVDDSVDPGEGIDSPSVDAEKAVPEPAVEIEPENSVGTGPVISFGTGSEDGDETEPEDSNETESEDSNATEPEDGDDTEIDDG